MEPAKYSTMHAHRKTRKWVSMNADMMGIPRCAQHVTHSNKTNFNLRSSVYNTFTKCIADSQVYPSTLQNQNTPKVNQPHKLKYRIYTSTSQHFALLLTTVLHFLGAETTIGVLGPSLSTNILFRISSHDIL